MIKGLFAVNQGSAQSATTAVMVNGNTIFTVGGGPIQILALQSVCVTANDATASTLQYQSVPTVGTAAAISGASASLASLVAGDTVNLNQTSLATAPDVVLASAGAVVIGPNVANRMVIQPGTIKLVIGVGSTTGTWKHYIAYVPLAPGVTVV